VKILITGASGQLGYWLKKIFAHDEVLATDKEELNIVLTEEVNRVVEEFKPDVIIHGAAFTNVDGAETDSEIAFLVNEVGTRNLANAAAKVGAKMVYVSTDYVYDGEKGSEYFETNTPNPQSIYGKSKLAGEKAVQESGAKYIIARTAWLYGQNGSNFVETMLRLAQEKDKVTVVNDQVGSPTYAKDLAEVLKKLINKEAEGIFHTVCSGSCSWFDFAKEIFRQSEISTLVEPMTTAQLNRPAKRPAYSVLNLDKLKDLGIEMRDWKEALRDYLDNRN
jgi:dTDP-4-dehydrorhamnose reductase